MKRVFAIPILLFLVFAISAQFLVPSFYELEGLRNKINKKKDIVHAGQEYIKEVNALYEKLKDYSDVVDNINAAIPLEPSFPSMLDFFMKQADNNGLALTSFSPGTGLGTMESASKQKKGGVKKATTIAGLKSSKFSVNLVGTFSSLESFIQDIQNSSRIIEVETMGISKKSKGQVLGITLKMKVFSY